MRRLFTLGQFLLYMCSNVGVHVAWWQLCMHMCEYFTDYAQNYVYAFNHLHVLCLK